MSLRWSDLDTLGYHRRHVRDAIDFGLLPVTDRVRTLIDHADGVGYEELRAVADQLPSLPKRRLIEVCARVPNRAGAERTHRLIHSEDAHTRSASTAGTPARGSSSSSTPAPITRGAGSSRPTAFAIAPSSGRGSTRSASPGTTSTPPTPRPPATSASVCTL